jgi:hypothetical protein
MVELEDESDVAIPESSQFVRRKAGQVPIIDAHLSGVRPVQTSQQV